MTRGFRGRPAALALVGALILSTVCPQQAEAKSALRLNRKKATLNVGASLRLKVKGTKKKVKWTTSKKKVAAVSQKGKVTGKKAGTAKITARVAGKKLVCKVTVRSKKKVSKVFGDEGLKRTSPPQTPPPAQTTAPTQTAASTQTAAPIQTAAPTQTAASVQTEPPTQSDTPGGADPTDKPEEPSQTPILCQTVPPQTPPPVVDTIPVEFFQTTEPDYESGTPEMPILSSDSGIYENAFELGMRCQPGTEIYYTTDGSVPTEQSAKYTGAIIVQDRNGVPNVLTAAENIRKMYISGSGYDYVPQADEVAKCTIIRAVAVSPDHQTSAVATRSYFVGNDVKLKYAGATVMSMVIDPDSLLNYDTGIHVLGKLFDEWKNTDEGKQLTGQWMNQYWKYQGNYTQSGREWEREAFIDYFDSEGETLEFSVPVGVRLHGGASRMYGQKSFKFYLREEYGQKNLKYPLIPGDLDKDGKQIKKYKNFMMRNGGNDTEYSKIRDVFNQAQVTDRAYGVQAARPCVLFLNGEYWGLYNLTERFSDNTLEENYGVDKDNMVVFKEGELDEGQDGDEALYEELWSYADKDFTDPAVYEQFCQIMDIDSFTDYYATEIYIANSDWEPEKNYLLWRARTPDAENPYADGKWRYLLYDTEYSMGLYDDSANQVNTDSYRRTIQNDPLFAAVTQNSEFRQKFSKTIAEIGSQNFNPETCSKKLDEIAAVYKPLMDDYYVRFFGKDAWQTRQFDQTVSSVKQFLKQRYASIINKIPKQ